MLNVLKKEKTIDCVVFPTDGIDQGKIIKLAIDPVQYDRFCPADFNGSTLSPADTTCASFLIDSQVKGLVSQQSP